MHLHGFTENSFSQFHKETILKKEVKIVKIEIYYDTYCKNATEKICGSVWKNFCMSLEMLYLKMRHLSLPSMSSQSLFFYSLYCFAPFHFKLDTGCMLHCIWFSVHYNFKKLSLELLRQYTILGISCMKLKSNVQFDSTMQSVTLSCSILGMSCIKLKSNVQSTQPYCLRDPSVFLQALNLTSFFFFLTLNQLQCISL